MSSEPAPNPTRTAAADESGLSLEIEPLLFFHPTLAGLATPGSIQPFPGPFPFDEEPAIWLQLERGDLGPRQP